MENEFKRVHTKKDIIISSIIIIAGICVFLASKATGAALIILGIIMLLVWKAGYKKGEGPVLVKKAFDVARSCRTSLTGFLDGDDVEPLTDKPGNGGVVRLEVYFSKEESLAYARLYDFQGYNYSPATALVELDGPRADKLISKI